MPLGECWKLVPELGHTFLLPNCGQGPIFEAPCQAGFHFQSANHGLNYLPWTCLPSRRIQSSSKTRSFTGDSPGPHEHQPGQSLCCSKRRPLEISFAVRWAGMALLSLANVTITVFKLQINFKVCRDIQVIAAYSKMRSPRFGPTLGRWCALQGA